MQADLANKTTEALLSSGAWSTVAVREQKDLRIQPTNLMNKHGAVPRSRASHAFHLMEATFKQSILFEKGGSGRITQRKNISGAERQILYL